MLNYTTVRLFNAIYSYQFIICFPMKSMCYYMFVSEKLFWEKFVGFICVKLKQVFIEIYIRSYSKNCFHQLKLLLKYLQII